MHLLLRFLDTVQNANLIFAISVKIGTEKNQNTSFLLLRFISFLIIHVDKNITIISEFTVFYVPFLCMYLNYTVCIRHNIIHGLFVSTILFDYKIRNVKHVD